MNRTYQKTLLLAVICFSLMLLLGSVALAQEPGTLPTTGASNRAYEYITALDKLRAMNTNAPAPMLAHPEVYEFSSDLQRLNALAVRGPAYMTNGAYGYITELDNLRAMRVNE
jgi:hypothetical protein